MECIGTARVFLTDRPPVKAGLRVSAPALAGTVFACLVLLVGAPVRVYGQPVPSGPVTVAGGRLTISGEASAAVGSADRGYFDYSGYSYNLLRLIRADAMTDLRIATPLSLLADVRVEGATDGEGWNARAYALFARIRPWRDRAFDIQAGLIPPVFGAFSRRAYGTDNPLIGFPLGYQYLTSLRADAVPASADDLLKMRGRGWRTRYPVGNTTPSDGLPVIDGLRYQSGVEVRAGDGRPVEVSAAWTAGSLSMPSMHDGRAGRQLSGRIAVRPFTGAVLGASVSRGVFLSDALTRSMPSGDSGRQTAVGFDGEYSLGHWLVRAEGIVSSWHLPRLRPPFIESPLRAVAFDVEGRYRIAPGVYAAVRVDRLGFSEIVGTAGRLPWEAPVSRIELGGGYSLFRNAVLKLAWQHNRRNAGYNADRTADLASAQLLVWF